MEALFTAFDEDNEGDDALIISLKWGILTNGNDKIDKTAMRKSLMDHMIERITDSAGFEEIDDDPAPCIVDEEGPFKFKGVLEILSHLTNAFGRRSWCQEPE